MDLASPRLLETLGMLPILHAPAGPITVAVAGPLADQLAGEALKWREVQKVYSLHPLKIKDRRIEVVKVLPRGAAHVVMLSPEQQPGPWWPALAKDGIIIASTGEQGAWQRLLDDFRKHLGTATPWRNWLPQPLYGAIGRNGPAKAGRTRQPPKAAKHLSPQYLPVLFTFARDELPMAFTRSTVRLANQPGSVHELA